MISGIVIVAFSSWLMAAHFSTLNWLLGIVLGAILIIVGLFLLVTELMETWLTQGQKALVDGLQAG